MSLHFLFEVLQPKLGYDFAFEEMNFALSVAGEAGPVVTMQMGVRNPSIKEYAIAVPDSPLLSILKINDLL